MKPATKHLALENVTEKQDKSPKGTIDLPIIPFMDIINPTDYYNTISSCSGRIVLWCEKTLEFPGSWLFVSHDPLPLSDSDAFTLLFEKANVVEKSQYEKEGKQLLYLKFEPFILHVESTSYEKAKELFTRVYNLGWRNSGMIPSKKNVVIIKSTLKLDVPIGYFDPRTRNVSLIVEKEYLEFLIQIGRAKFQENQKRTTILLEALQSDFKSMECS
jgi:tRNA wybutosine-synthesizing protein 3